MRHFLTIATAMACISFTQANTATLNENLVMARVEVNGFEKISASELPPPVVEALLKDYPTSKLAGAFRNEKGDFKLLMVLKSGTKRTVYIDSQGHWIKFKK